ncbi:hypothetical protein HWD03_gp034 [Alteromonas phage vB_AmeM_PT11-V22]|uniref:Uncharacterized protein n=1 Tax=Alteromonas phage vB_AmeM_PT11-V22 TaxID=2704031 RepID=A0A6C0R1V3_9CAUD|nr:hypothetical protein HWD03_gp034 [Alteromonas phage vB_AmeM_PT11-V22]QHZ59757.1 hypothetical protein [Alteromonas phage vB_AmeM_PT11-V22]
MSKITDLFTKQGRSVTSLIESGGWVFKQIDTYTEASPLTVVQGNKVKLTIPLQDEGFFRSKYFELSYDYTSQKFTPVTEDDVYLANFRMKAKPSTQAGYLNFTLESPNVSYNPLNGGTLTFTKSANEEHFFSPDLTVFIGEDVRQNGIEVWVEAVDCDVEIYDYSFLITRLFSDKRNP